MGIRAIMTRDDIPSANMEFKFDALPGFPVAIGGKYSYTLAFKGRLPPKFYLDSDGIEKYVRAYPGLEFVVANTLAKWKKLEPCELS